MSISLAEIQESIKSEIKVNADGVGYVTIKGAARLANVSDSTLVRQFKGADLEPSKLAIFLMGFGFSAADLQGFATNMIPDMALGVILNYYAMRAGRYCTYEAQLAVFAFTAIGVRTWLQRSVGYVEQRHIRINTKVAKHINTTADAEEKLSKNLKDFIRYCDGQPRTTGYFGSHSLMRRQAVLELFGSKKQRYLRKAEIIKLFKCAEEMGLGTVKANKNKIYTFTPSDDLPRLTA